MKSIRSVFVALMVVVLVITAGILTAVNYTKTETVVVQGIEQSLADTTKVAAHEVEFWLQLRKAEMEGIANTPILLSGDQQAINAYLLMESKRMPVYSAFWVADPAGNWYSPVGTSGSISERDYYKALIKTGKSIISDPLIGKADGKMAVVVAIPIKSNGQLVGILGGNVKMDELLQVVSTIKIGQTGFATLYQADGTVIADKDAEKIMKYNPLKDEKSPLAGVVKNMQMGKPGLQSIRDNNGREAYIAYAPLQDAKWTIASTAFTDEFKGPLSSIKIWSSVSALVLVILAAGIVALFARRITTPLQQLQQAAEKLAQGDCSAVIDIRDEHEIGKLAEAFKTMTGNIQQLIGHIRQSSLQVASSSEQLTASAEQSAQAANQIAGIIMEVAQGADVQVDAVNKATGVVEQIAGRINRAAESVGNVTRAAEQTAQAAEAGDKSVDSAVNQMQHIEAAVTKVATVIDKLGERSTEIGQIVDTISDIAGQTNLLALNAAIEAARAGEQGRGFAVVAEEVRKLAEQSQDAAKKIAGLIGDIQRDTGEAVHSMEEGTREVAKGTEVVTSAGTAFKAIVGLIEHVATQVEGIKEAIDQVAGGGQELVLAVQAIDGISRETAGQTQNISAATEEQSASMQEVASSSQALSKMAEALQAAVSKFKL